MDKYSECVKCGNPPWLCDCRDSTEERITELEAENAALKANLERAEAEIAKLKNEMRLYD